MGGAQQGTTQSGGMGTILNAGMRAMQGNGDVRRDQNAIQPMPGLADMLSNPQLMAALEQLQRDNQKRLHEERMRPRQDARMMREMQLYNYDNDPAAGGGY